MSARLKQGATGGRRVPEGYAAVPISRGMAASPIRACVLVRRQPDPIGGHLVSVRERFDARVFAGALCDKSGAVLDWLEIWVQTADGLASTAGAVRESLSNAVLDQRWERLAEAWRAEGGLSEQWSTIALGMENGAERSPPVWIDPHTGQPIEPEGGGGAWRLAIDDAALAAAGLPPYSTSLHRYLTDGKNFAAVTREAPSGAACIPLERLVNAGLVPLAPEGARVLVRRLAPVGLETYCGFLGDPKSGELRVGVPHGRSIVELEDATTRDLGSPAGAFVMDHLGARTRLIELLFLKLRLVADAVAAVQQQVAATGRPLLSLGPESLRVRLGSPARGLPRFWSARAELVDPGEAVELSIPAGDATYFVRPAGGDGASIYRPESASGSGLSGSGQLRIRRVLAQGSDELILEATLTTHERVNASRNDLVRLRVGLGSARVDLYGRLESDTALAGGELRVRTLPQRVVPAVADAIRAAEGVPLASTGFEVIPLLSTPCDLYSLGVLATRILLVGGGGTGSSRSNTLPVALDEMLSLARELASGWKEDETAWRRVGALCQADQRWLQSLGPQRLTTAEEINPQQALAVVPADLWFRILAFVAMCYPGIGPDSVCADLGDAPATALHRVFDRPLAAIEDLLLRTRSLIVVDWEQNREIHGVLRRFATGVTAARG